MLIAGAPTVNNTGSPFEERKKNSADHSSGTPHRKTPSPLATMSSAARDEFNDLMRDKSRRSRHPEDDEDDSDDARSFLNLSDNDDDTTPPASTADPDEQAPPRPSTSHSRHTIPRTRYQANTGPKGVISDAQNFRDSRRNHHRQTTRSSTSLASHMRNGLSLRDAGPVGGRAGASDEEEEEEEEGEDGDLDLDDGFMSRWRNSRLQELQNGGARAGGSRMHARTRGARVWGTLTAVDGEGYLAAVEKSPAETVVVVYIYDDCVSSPSSSSMSSSLSRVDVALPNRNEKY